MSGKVVQRMGRGAVVFNSTPPHSLVPTIPPATQATQLIEHCANSLGVMG